jgi:prepilin-type N-terminal cleavage/methylation domain-containing protein
MFANCLGAPPDTDTRNARSIHRERGFTLIEVLMVVAIAATLTATTIPAIFGAMRQYELNSSVQMVGTAIRNARYAAVTKNRTVRVRFNCPAANQFRVVERVGTFAIDTAADRCSEATYPYPDADPAAAPNVDGPVLRLSDSLQFAAVEDIEITPAGRAIPLTGCPACAASTLPGTIAISNGDETRTLTVTTTGQVLLP